MQSLLEVGAPMSQASPDSGRNVIHHVAEGGNIAAMKRFCSMRKYTSGTEYWIFEARDLAGKTTLEIAHEKGHNAIASTLMKSAIELKVEIPISLGPIGLPAS